MAKYKGALFVVFGSLVSCTDDREKVLPTITQAAVLCKRLDKRFESFPCEDVGHVFDYVMQSIQYNAQDADAWALFNELMKSLPQPVLSEQDQHAVVQAYQKRGDVNIDINYMSPQANTQYETASILGWPIKLPIISSMLKGMQRWDATQVFSQHLSSLLAPNGSYVSSRGLNILELGSGLGELGIALAKHGANVTIRTLRQNVDINGLKNSPNIRVKLLHWGKKLHPSLNLLGQKLDIILGSDLIYCRFRINGTCREDGSDPLHFHMDPQQPSTGRHELVETLVELTSMPAALNTPIIMGYRHRENGVFASFCKHAEPYFSMKVEAANPQIPGAVDVLTPVEIEELKHAAVSTATSDPEQNGENIFVLTLLRRQDTNRSDGACGSGHADPGAEGGSPFVPALLSRLGTSEQPGMPGGG
jgi:hypothetical protein